MKETLTPVEPVSPIAPYVGGKHLLAKRIMERMKAIDHNAYVEPFVGMGGVFFRRPVMARCEVINDLNRDVSNLFRVLQRHYVPLMDMLRWQVTSRADFERLRNAQPDTLTDLERACRFLYLQRTAFGGQPVRPTFGTSKTTSARFDVTKLVPMLEDVHARLSRVVIECLRWQDVIKRYDSAGTLFYLDPPYYGCENYYNASFTQDQFEEMAVLLQTIKGRFVLSLNDTPEVRKIFSQFNVEHVEVRYSLMRDRLDKERFKEVLISN
nr:DNA adenine methylase [uncultured Neokomagataea sp.]